MLTLKSHQLETWLEQHWSNFIRTGRGDIAISHIDWCNATLGRSAVDPNYSFVEVNFYPERRWCYTVGYGKPHLLFWFRDAQDAVLFKLRWAS